MGNDIPDVNVWSEEYTIPKMATKCELLDLEKTRKNTVKSKHKTPHKLVRIEEIWIKKYSEDLTGKSGQNKTKHRRHHNGHEQTFLFQQDSFPFSHMCNPVQMRCHTNILNCSLLPARVVIMAAGAVLLR